MRKPTEGGKRVPSAFLAQAYKILVGPEHETFPVLCEPHFLCPIHAQNRQHITRKENIKRQDYGYE